MLFALPILLLVCLQSICGNEVIDKNKEFTNNNNNTHFVSAANRPPLQQRNQTKITRDDQLHSLLAYRRRQILQNRFKSHIQNIVEITNGSTVPTIPKNIHLPNNTKSINVHLNLSDLLKNADDNANQSNASTESNLVNVSSSPRTTNKPTSTLRKNVETTSQNPENKNGGKNMPIIRNILYRRKMSYLNRKLPLDFEQIAFDTLGISEINKNPEDLIFDNEDSLQVEESSHDKLIYYDVKNNSSKKSGNNFEDSSDEMKTMSMMNKTSNMKTTTTTIRSTSEESTSNSSNFDDIVVLLNTTEATISTTQKNENVKNNTRFMSASLYNYFRPLDVPEEEMQPFLHFGEKLPNVKPSQSPKLPEKKKPEEISKQHEEEIHENMDVLQEKSILIENKITKMNLPNQKVNAARDYYKTRNHQNLQNSKKNTTEITTPQKQKTVAQLRNATRNRGFRNQTIFYQNKRNGVRQTINLRGNVTLSDLKPSTVVSTQVTIGTPDVTTATTTGSTTENAQNITTPQTKSPETSILPIVTVTDKQDDLLTSSTKYLVDSTTTSTAPRTTRILSTAVVTSVSVEQKPKNSTKIKDLVVVTPEVQTTTDINDSDATVVAALSNFTLQAFQNNTKTLTRNPATVYPSIDIPLRDISSGGPSGLYAHHLEYAVPQINTTTTSTTPKVQTTQTTPKTKFILRPNRRPTTQAISTTEFVINVEDEEQTDISLKTDLETTTSFSTTTTQSTKIIIDSRFGFNDDITTTFETTIPTTPKPKVISTTPTTTSTTTLTPKATSITTLKPKATSTTTLQPKTTVPTTLKTTTVSTTSTTTTTKPPNRTFNTTMLSKSESELPLATLFSVTDFKKPENQTRPRIPTLETVISRKSENEVSLDNIHAAYILAALGFLPMMVIVIYVVRSVMKKKHKNIEDFEAEMHHDSEKKSIIHPVARLPTLVLDTSNRWEFPRGKLRLQTLLGQGNFGQVWKAEADDLKGHVGLTRLVAVKTIKDGAGSKERDDLLKELAIMQKMGSHPNVVTLLGCCTDKEPYLLIMEYVMYGKLLTFLRDHRTRRDYYNFSDDAATLTARDLTVFAYCVARGMEYLSSKGIIHRDLAARNILVDHNKLCKIADFGMSRDVGANGEINEPRQPRNALPVRWMAIESLMYSVFSSKSDVWAFGVLLWEIVTLGSSPYANMSGREVMRLVCEGYRLERPSHCRPELYRVMASTWSADAAQRPTFADLRADLAAMLDTAPAEGSYVDLESFRADSTVYEIDNCTPRGNYFTVKSRFSEFECDI